MPNLVGLKSTKYLQRKRKPSKWWRKKFLQRKRRREGHMSRAARRLDRRMRYKFRFYVRRKWRIRRSLTLKRIEQPSYSFRRRVTLSLFRLLLTQLLVYNRSKTSVVNKLCKLLRFLKSQQKTPIVYINSFIKRALPKIFLRDYRMGSKRLLVPIPASYIKRRLAFLKQFLKDTNSLNNQQGSTFQEKIFNEIEAFDQNRGQTYTRRVDSFIISKQNRNYSRYGYRLKSYKQKNVTKKSKLALI